MDQFSSRNAASPSVHKGNTGADGEPVAGRRISEKCIEADDRRTGGQTKAGDCVRGPSASCRGDKAEADRSSTGNHRSGRQSKTGRGCPAFFCVAGRKVGRTGVVVLLPGHTGTAGMG